MSRVIFVPPCKHHTCCLRPLHSSLNCIRESIGIPEYSVTERLNDSDLCLNFIYTFIEESIEKKIENTVNKGSDIRILLEAKQSFVGKDTTDTTDTTYSTDGSLEATSLPEPKVLFDNISGQFARLQR